MGDKIFMILKQYYDLVKSYMLNKSVTVYDRGNAATTYTSVSADITEKIVFVINLRYNFESCTTIGSSSSTYGKIVLGSGTTPASENDVWLKNYITSGISGSVTKTIKENEVVTKYITITNTSDSDIVIGEIGFATTSVYIDSRTTATCLLDRTVLTEPITIPAGGTGRVEYSIDFNQEV